MFPGTAPFTCRIQKGYPEELRHEMPYPESLFRTPDLQTLERGGARIFWSRFQQLQGSKIHKPEPGPLWNIYGQQAFQIAGENDIAYHGPQNYYVHNSQGNSSCSCNCQLVAKHSLSNFYLTVVHAFPCETEAHAKMISLENILCNCDLARNHFQNIVFFVSNVFVVGGILARKITWTQGVFWYLWKYAFQPVLVR